MSARKYAPSLWLLTALFAVRVAAQPAALAFDAALLPSFDSWHGGLLPYPVLLLTQFLVLGWMGQTAWRFTTGEVAANRQRGRLVLAFGVVYFVVMLVRLLLGATVLGRVRWFASPLPAFFHLVLAAYLVLLAHFHVYSGVASALRPMPSRRAPARRETPS